MKIGMYTEDEILEHLTEGEGRGFLGRSMYDAIFDKIHALITENEQLKQDNVKLGIQLEDRAYQELKIAYKQLQNNWNELKKHLKEVIEEIENNEYADAYDNCKLATTRTIFRKMQELEGKSE